MTTKIYLVNCSIIFTIILAYAICRDMQFDKQYPDDLRNRVVGARLIKDGRSPYFYKWKKEDGVRYYDPKSFDRYKVSNITASPFFHHLMYPFTELPQREISKWWLFLEYWMFLACVFLAIKMANINQQKLLVVLLAAGFLFTEGWKVHILAGQNYLCLPFLAFLFYYFISIRQRPWAGIIAGCCAIAMFLIHANALFFFIPFLWGIKNYSKYFLAAFLAPVVLVCSFILFNKQERLFWVDYKEHIDEQIKLHQGLGVAVKINEPDPHFTDWEGINHDKISRYRTSHPVHLYSENGNVFYVLKILLHKKISLWWLTILSVITIAFFVFLFAFFHKHDSNIALSEIALLGFCLYMITEFFSPILRWQYYSVQWLFPILIAAATYKRLNKWAFFLLGAGLLLNILNTGLITMEHTLGEYCMLLAFLILSLGDGWQPQLKNKKSIPREDHTII